MGHHWYGPKNMTLSIFHKHKKVVKVNQNFIHKAIKSGEYLQQFSGFFVFHLIPKSMNITTWKRRLTHCFVRLWYLSLLSWWNNTDYNAKKKVRSMFGPRRQEWQTAGENCMVKRFTIYAFHQMLLGLIRPIIRWEIQSFTKKIWRKRGTW
jgi:hypothetical protein